MRYYIQYTLDHDNPDDNDAINEAIEMQTGYIDFSGGSITDNQWDDWYDDMRSVSVRFPDTVFVLTGVSEDNIDMWKARFIDGMVEEVRGEVVYPAFPTYIVDVDDEE
jgi:hypothetical protein